MVDKSLIKQAIETKVAQVAAKDSVPATPEAAGAISTGVIQEIGPLLDALASGLPWYQNPVVLGILLTFATRLLAHFGWAIPEEYHGEILNALVALGPYVGSAIALGGVYFNRWLKRSKIELPDTPNAPPVAKS